MACSRALEAWTRRRKARLPSDDKSRTSNRRSGFRNGVTFEVNDGDSSENSICDVSSFPSVDSWDGGIAEECGAGGVEVEAVGDVIV
jgi:hypothetical protein